MAAAFDAFRAAVRNETYRGVLHARDLPRVADRLADAAEAGSAPISDEVRWTITGCRSDEGRPALAIEMEAVLPLVCQRCLRPMAWSLKQTSEVLLAHDEAEVAALDAASEQEVVLADAALAPHTLVEDELVLTLPFVPRHQDSCPPADG